MGVEKKEMEFERAAKNTYRSREKNTGSPVIGTLACAEIGVWLEGTEESEGNSRVGVETTGVYQNAMRDGEVNGK